MKTLYHLKGKNFSGRAVKVEPLDETEARENLTGAARVVGPDATMLQLKKQEWLSGWKQMVKEVSEPCENPLAAETKWRKVEVSSFDDPAQFFTAKDCMALEAIFRDFHEVGEAELEAITGKAVPLSEG